MTGFRVIAIDGPAASGKSSTGALVAEALGLRHLDSGAMYRAVTWVALESGRADAAGIIAAASALPVDLVAEGRELLVRAAGKEIDEAIRSPDVTAAVSRVSALPEVRDWVTGRLREVVRAAGGAVVDGRDIGTVVFPDAPLKVFLVATPVARAERRLRQRGGQPTAEAIAAEAAKLAERDRLDSSRAVAPLRPAGDAVVVDTTGQTLAEQVAAIVGLARARGL